MQGRLRRRALAVVVIAAAASGTAAPAASASLLGGLLPITITGTVSLPITHELPGLPDVDGLPCTGTSSLAIALDCALGYGQAVVLNYRVYANGREQDTPGLLDVPTPLLTPTGLIPLPAFVGTLKLTNLSGPAVELDVDRLLPAAAKVIVEVTVPIQQPDGTFDRQVFRLGYDAREAGAPQHFAAQVDAGQVSSGHLGMHVTTTAPGSALTLVGEMAGTVSATARFSPVPTAMSADVGFATPKTVAIDTNLPTDLKAHVDLPGAGCSGACPATIDASASGMNPAADGEHSLFARVATGPLDAVLDTTGRLSGMSVDTTHIGADAMHAAIAHPSSHTEVVADGDHVSYEAAPGQRADRIDFAADGLAGLPDPYHRVVAQLSDVAPHLDVDFGSPITFDGHGEQTGRVVARLAPGAGVPLDAPATDQVVVNDTPEDHTLLVAISHLVGASVQTSPLAVKLQTTGGGTLDYRGRTEETAPQDGGATTRLPDQRIAATLRDLPPDLGFSLATDATGTVTAAVTANGGDGNDETLVDARDVPSLPRPYRYLTVRLDHLPQRLKAVVDGSPHVTVTATKCPSGQTGCSEDERIPDRVGRLAAQLTSDPTLAGSATNPHVGGDGVYTDSTLDADAPHDATGGTIYARVSNLRSVDFQTVPDLGVTLDTIGHGDLTYEGHTPQVDDHGDILPPPQVIHAALSDVAPHLGFSLATDASGHMHSEVTGTGGNPTGGIDVVAQDIPSLQANRFLDIDLRDLPPRLEADVNDGSRLLGLTTPAGGAIGSLVAELTGDEGAAGALAADLAGDDPAVLQAPDNVRSVPGTVFAHISNVTGASVQTDPSLDVSLDTAGGHTDDGTPRGNPSLTADLTTPETAGDGTRLADQTIHARLADLSPHVGFSLASGAGGKVHAHFDGTGGTATGLVDVAAQDIPSLAPANRFLAVDLRGLPTHLDADLNDGSRLIRLTTPDGEKIGSVVAQLTGDQGAADDLAADLRQDSPAILGRGDAVTTVDKRVLAHLSNLHAVSVQTAPLDVSLDTAAGHAADGTPQGNPSLTADLTTPETDEQGRALPDQHVHADITDLAPHLGFSLTSIPKDTDPPSSEVDAMVDGTGGSQTGEIRLSADDVPSYTAPDRYLTLDLHRLPDHLAVELGKGSHVIDVSAHPQSSCSVACAADEQVGEVAAQFTGNPALKGTTANPNLTTDGAYRDTTAGSDTLAVHVHDLTSATVQSEPTLELGLGTAGGGDFSYRGVTDTGPIDAKVTGLPEQLGFSLDTTAGQPMRAQVTGSSADGRIGRRTPSVHVTDRDSATLPAPNRSLDLSLSDLPPELTATIDSTAPDASRIEVCSQTLGGTCGNTRLGQATLELAADSARAHDIEARDLDPGQDGVVLDSSVSTYGGSDVPAQDGVASHYAWRYVDVLGTTVGPTWVRVADPQHEPFTFARISGLRHAIVNTANGSVDGAPRCQTSHSSVFADTAPPQTPPGDPVAQQPKFAFVSHATGTYFTRDDQGDDKFQCTSNADLSDENRFDRDSTLRADLGHLRPDTDLSISTVDHGKNDFHHGPNLLVDYRSQPDGAGADPLELDSTAFRIGRLHTDVTNLPPHAQICFDSGSPACGDTNYAGGTVSFRADMFGTRTVVPDLWLCMPNSDQYDHDDDVPPAAFDCNQAPEGEDGTHNEYNGLNVRDLVLAKLQAQVDAPWNAGIDTGNQELWGLVDYYPDGTPLDDAQLAFGSREPNTSEVHVGPQFGPGFRSSDRQIEVGLETDLFGGSDCGAPVMPVLEVYERFFGTLHTDAGDVSVGALMCEN
jgi:hypothetical protein